MMVIVVRMVSVLVRSTLDPRLSTIFHLHIEFNPGDAGFLFAENVKMPAVELQFFQLAFQFARVHAQINQRADEHVAADAAEKIEVKRFHFSTSALIWLAA